MANFKQHLFFGSTVSALGAFVGYWQLGLTRVQAGSAFFLGTLASLAPDLDHAESIPGRTFFELLGVLIPISLLFHFAADDTRTFKLEHWIWYFGSSYFVVRYVFFLVFDKLTDHRGIFHSLPAAVICAQVVYLLFVHLPLTERLTLCAVAGAGYLTHLIADECYSVDWENNAVKRSFGTAVDLGHIRDFSTWVAYALLIGLGWLIWQQSAG